MKLLSLPRSFVLAWGLFLLPITALSYSNSSVSTSTALGSGDEYKVCACVIVFSTTPEMWYNEIFNVTGPTVIYTVDEDTHSTIGSSVISNNVTSTVIPPIGGAVIGRYLYTTLGPTYDASIVLTQTNHFGFSYTFYGPATQTLAGGQVTSQCAGSDGPGTHLFTSTTGPWSVLPLTSNYEYTTTYVGQPQFIEGAGYGVEAFDAFGVWVAAQIGAPNCSFIGAGGTGDLKVAVSVLTSVSTVFSKAAQVTSDTAVSTTAPLPGTTTSAAPADVSSVIQASSTPNPIPTPTPTPEATPEPAPTPSTLSTAPSPLPATEPIESDTPAVSETTLIASPDTTSPKPASPTTASQPVANPQPAPSQSEVSQPQASRPQASSNAPPANNPSPAPTPTPQTTILFTLPTQKTPPAPNQNQPAPSTPITTTISLGPSSLPATIVILPSTSGFVIGTNTLTLNGPAATLASQIISVGSSGLEIINSPTASLQPGSPTPTPSTLLLVPIITHTQTTDNIGSAIASILNLPSQSPASNPIITIGDKPYTISAAESGGVVIGSQTLTSGGNVVVEGSTLSLVPSGAGTGIVVKGPAATTTVAGGEGNGNGGFGGGGNGGGNATTTGEGPVQLTGVSGGVRVDGLRVWVLGGGIGVLWMFGIL